jgi:tetratricopeptide (TPR) repeat protein
VTSEAASTSPWLTRLFGAALLLFVASRCLAPMDETDVFFNLRLGEIVLATHGVPRTNLLSFTAPDAPDVNLAWLFQIVLVLAHRLAGIPGTVVLKTTFVVATFAALFRVAIRRGAHPALAAAALALSAWAAEPRFVERPHLVTFLGLALTLLALEHAETGRSRALLALVPAGLVWANANSCFFLAPAVLLLYAFGARLDGRRADGRRAVLVALALVPLAFATPSGADVLRYVANHFRMPYLRPLQEYRTASWPVDGPFFFLIAAVCAGAASRPRAWRQLLPIVALAILGARRIRFVAEFSLLAGPYVAATFTRLAARVTVGARGRTAASVVVGATLVGLTLAPRLLAARSGEPIFDLDVEPDLVPRAAIDFVADNGLREHMYNDLEVGSYLTWEGWPRHRVFQDPRINGYPDAMHAVLRRADLTRGQWQRFLDGFGVTSALISYPSQNPRAALFEPALWALVYHAGDGLVFARRTADHADVIRRDELPIEIIRDGDGTAERVLEARPSASPVADCAWWGRVAEAFVERHEDARARPFYERALGDTSAPCGGAARDAWADALGDLALRLEDRETAVAAYAHSNAPGARVKRGLALLALQRPREALEDLRTARRDDPDALLGEGLALSALGRREEARAVLEAFMRLAPNHVGAARARAELARPP